MKKIVWIILGLCFVCGCTLLNKHERSIMGEWTGRDEYLSADVMFNIDESTQCTTEYIMEQEPILTVDSTVHLYFGKDAYEYLTQNEDSLQWEKSLVDEWLGYHDEFTLDHLIAIKYSDIKVDTHGYTAWDKENTKTSSLGLMFISDDQTTLYLCNKESTVNDAGYTKYTRK